MGIEAWSITPANNNSAPPAGAPEGMAPSTVNDTMRQQMADHRSQWNDAQWFRYGDGDGAATTTYVAATQFKVVGADVSAHYHVGRRVKAQGTTTGTIYGTITAVSFSTDTTVTVAWDSGSLANEALTIWTGVVGATNSALPQMDGLLPIAAADAGRALVANTLGSKIVKAGPFYAGHRNLLHNGAMALNQRAGTYAVISSEVTLDRWKVTLGGSTAARFTISQQTNGGVDGRSNWLKALCTTANSPDTDDIVLVYQRIEAQNLVHTLFTSGGIRQCTVSFDIYADKDAGSGITFPAGLSVYLFTQDGTARSVSDNVSIAAEAVWQRVAVTFPVDATASVDNDTGAGLEVGICLQAGSARLGTAQTWKTGDNYQPNSGGVNWAGTVNNFIGITNVQLEVGPAATPFEHLPIHAELFRCQRYYRQYTNAWYYSGAAHDTNTAYFPLADLARMRATPTVLKNGNIQVLYSGGQVAVTAVAAAVNAGDTLGFSVDVSGTPFTAFSPVFLVFSGSPERIGFDADF
jgi:hypothetical protein